MNINLVDALEEDFPYLFEPRFVLLSKKEAQRLSSAELMSDDFRIEFEVLDGMLNVSIRHYYPLEQKYGYWHGLFTYIELFEGHPLEFPEQVAFASNEMKLLSRLLLQYMNKLKAFSRERTCEENERKLNEIGKNISERNWKKLGW
jgi:hypothetical protein